MSDHTEALKGSYSVTLEVEASIALSRLVGKWSAAEREAFLAGDEDAKEAAEDAAISLALEEGDVEVVRTDIRISEAPR